MRFLICLALLSGVATAQQKKTVGNRALDQDLILDTNSSFSVSKGIRIEGGNKTVHLERPDGNSIIHMQRDEDPNSANYEIQVGAYLGRDDLFRIFDIRGINDVAMELENGNLLIPNGGISINGGTDILDHYEEYTNQFSAFSCFAGGGSVSGATLDVKLVRVGSSVTGKINYINGTLSGSCFSLTTTGSLPANFRPIDSDVYFRGVNRNAVTTDSDWRISTTGAIQALFTSRSTGASANPGDLENYSWIGVSYTTH